MEKNLRYLLCCHWKIFKRVVWNSKYNFSKQSINPSRNTFWFIYLIHANVEFQLISQVRLIRKKLTLQKHGDIIINSMTQEESGTRIFWIDLTFEWYEDAMISRVIIFIFCLEPALGKDTWVRATFATVMVNLCHSESYFLNNWEANWEQHFERYPRVEDFTFMDQDTG